MRMDGHIKGNCRGRLTKRFSYDDLPKCDICDMIEAAVSCILTLLFIFAIYSAPNLVKELWVFLPFLCVFLSGSEISLQTFNFD